MFDFYDGGGLEAAGRDGALRLIRESPEKKLVPAVSHLSFIGSYVAGALSRLVRFITERAVFDLLDGALALVEIAPGIDLQRDVLDQCGAPMRVAADLRMMETRVFGNGPLRG